MASNPAFVNDEVNENSDKRWAKDVNLEKSYSYAEAIELAGNGWYNFGLLATLSLALLAMALDMFSFAIIVTLSSCDLELDVFRKNILVSMPFVGPILMAYPWGYISDTRGRRSCLLVALGVGFVLSAIGAFSPHWSMLAICRLFSTCFCSCAQSATYTLLGESCPERVKGAFMLVMTSSIHLNLSIYYPLAYFITNLGFSYDLGFITFVPWRLLVLILALPLGISTLCLLFFYESPKFLLNAGREDEALEVLKKIYCRNGHDGADYPVKKLVLLELGNIQHEKEEKHSLLQSLWLQTMPLFREPLLLKTILLYYLIFAIYSSNNALFVWLPFLAKSFSKGINSHNNKTQGLCRMIYNPHADITGKVIEKCTTIVDAPIVIAAVCAGCTYCILNGLISKLAARKRIVMMTVFFLAFVSGIGDVVIHNNVLSVILYFGILLNSLNMGVAFSYCVDLYPTSFRGMAACLGVMVARLSGILGVNIVGLYIHTDCAATFCGLSILMLKSYGTNKQANARAVTPTVTAPLSIPFNVYSNIATLSPSGASFRSTVVLFILMVIVSFSCHAAGTQQFTPLLFGCRNKCCSPVILPAPG